MAPLRGSRGGAGPALGFTALAVPPSFGGRHGPPSTRRFAAVPPVVRCRRLARSRLRRRSPGRLRRGARRPVPGARAVRHDHSPPPGPLRRRPDRRRGSRTCSLRRSGCRRTRRPGWPRRHSSRLAGSGSPRSARRALAVRTHVPPLPQRWLASLPEYLRCTTSTASASMSLDGAGAVRGTATTAAAVERTASVERREPRGPLPGAAVRPACRARARSGSVCSPRTTTRSPSPSSRRWRRPPRLAVARHHPARYVADRRQ